MKRNIVLALLVGILVGLAAGWVTGAKAAAKLIRYDTGCMDGTPHLYRINRYTGEAWIQVAGEPPRYVPYWCKVDNAP
jgi:hypothetical protein